MDAYGGQVLAWIGADGAVAEDKLPRGIGLSQQLFPQASEE